MRLWAYVVSCVLVLGGTSRGLAQQPTGPATLENLLPDEGVAPAERPVAVDATAPAAANPLPGGRIQGAVTRPKDGVQHPDLDKVWAEYDEEIETAAKAIEKAIDDELNAAAASGDLDAALKWKTAGEQFKKDGKIPAFRPQKPGRPPQAQIAEANKRLAIAYEAAEKGLVQSHDLEKAKQVRAEREALLGKSPIQTDERKVLVDFIGLWKNEDNGNLEEVRADGAYVVNRDPRNQWSGSWVLDLKDPKGPCVVRQSKNKTQCRWYLDPTSKDVLVAGDGIKIRRVAR